jgi:hypothetical protein
MVRQVEQIGRLLKEMASLIASATSAQLPDWFEVFFDQREDGDTGAGISRTIAKSDSSRKWIDIPVSVIGHYGDLLDLRGPQELDIGMAYSFILSEPGK